MYVFIGKLLGRCMICMFHELFIESRDEKKSFAVNPIAIVAKLKQISRDFTIGRMECGHEFKVTLFEALNGAQISIGTTPSPIEFFFVGNMKKSIKCYDCSNISTNENEFREIQLGLGGNTKTVQNAMNTEFEDETIDGYARPKCKKAVSGQIATSVLRAPEVLTVMLKRFNNEGDKISNMTKVEKELNLVCENETISYH